MNEHEQVSTKKQESLDDHGLHFTSMSIQNFRCFKSFQITSLARINLIGGKNNVGKTSLLEAIFLLLGTSNIPIIFKLNVFRGKEARIHEDVFAIRENLWRHFFYDFDDQSTISISAELGIAKQVELTLQQMNRNTTKIAANIPTNDTQELGQILKLQYRDINGICFKSTIEIEKEGEIEVGREPVPSILLPGAFVPARVYIPEKDMASRYGKFEISKKQDQILSALQIFEPRLKKISVVSFGTSSALYGDIGLSQMIPFALMGDGVRCLATVFLTIIDNAGGCVLIDEIESGLHQSMLVDVWKAIARIAKEHNVQIFAVTHSWECIQAAAEVFQDSAEQDFVYHRLEQNNEGDIEAENINAKILQTMVESGLEAR